MISPDPVVQFNTEKFTWADKPDIPAPGLDSVSIMLRRLLVLYVSFTKVLT